MYCKCMNFHREPTSIRVLGYRLSRADHRLNFDNSNTSITWFWFILQYKYEILQIT